jgi:hypothetical protein
MTAITLNLPEQTMQQARQAAAALQKPVEEVLAEMLAAVLPTVQDAPAEMQAELTRMTWLNNQALWEIARRTMSPEDQASMEALARQQGERALTEMEQSRLEALRREYGRITLMKARAYALLSVRGGKPLLAQV